MKSLLKFAGLAVVAYVIWDLWGNDMKASVQSVAASAKDQIGGLVPGAGEADFELRHDSRTKKFSITSRHDPELAVRSEMDDLARYLHTPETIVPLVRVSYDASAFASAAEQARFEASIRQQLAKAQARPSFVVSGRPQTL